MDFRSWFGSFTKIEIVVVALFILFLAVPVSLPKSVNGFIDSALGMILLFAATVFFFLYTNPVVGVLFIFVAYELLRRASIDLTYVPVIDMAPLSGPSVPSEGPAQPIMPVPISKSTEGMTVEEEVIAARKPANISAGFVDDGKNGFKPVASVIQGSTYR